MKHMQKMEKNQYVVAAEPRGVKFKWLIYHLRATLLAMLPFAFLISTYFKLEKLAVVTVMIMAVVLVLSLPMATGSSKILGYILIGASVGIFIFNGSSLEDWKSGVQGNIDLICLFLTIPFLSVPLKHGNYLVSVESLFKQKVKKNYQVYGFSLIMAFLLGSVFNLASLHIIHQLFCNHGNKERKELVLLAAVRGFTACIFWSPTFFSVGLVLTMTEVRWVEMFPYGFTLSLAVLLLGFIMDVVDKKQKKVPEVMDQGEDLPHEVHIAQINYSKLWELGFLGIAVLALAIILNTFLHLSILVLVPTVAIIMPLFWLLFLGKLPIIPGIAKEYYQQELPNHSNEIVLFTGIGMLASAIKSSSLDYYLVIGLEKIISSDPFFSMALISFFIAALFVVGISPIITIFIVTSSLPLLSVQWEPLFLSLGLITGWAIGIVLSPFAALNLMVGLFIQKTPIQVSLKKNYLYALLMLPVIWGLMALFF
ncbi:MAG: hypothetical protein SCK28_06510 [Bacillota bacterium]|nr:hypothetical protein [Bacillota bacterium]